MLIDIFIADAMAAPFEGLSEGHVKSARHDFESYFDSRILLKDHPEKWTKPGLYSSISPALTACAYCALTGNNDFSCVRSHYEKILTLNDLRNPDAVLANFAVENTEIYSDCYFVLYAGVYAKYKKRGDIQSFFPFLCSLTKQPHHFASSLALMCLLRDDYSDGKSALESLRSTISWAQANQPLIFKEGINPDIVIKSLQHIEHMCAIVVRQQEEKQLWGEFYAYASAVLGRNVVRPSLSVYTLIPFALWNVLNQHNSTQLLAQSILPGGAARAMAILSALLSNFHFSEDIPMLADTLVNKRKVIEICESLEQGRYQARMMSSFIAAETALTRKESEERNALLKHFKRKRPVVKVNKSRDSMTAHVVESWTKVDKARYKKQKRHIADETEE